MKALLNNFRVSIYVCLFVLLLSVACYVYIPKGLQATVDALQSTVQSKRMLVQTLQHAPKPKPVTVPLTGQDWLNKLPYDPQVDRVILQMQDIIQQTNISLESITMNGTNTNTTIQKQVTNSYNKIVNQANGTSDKVQNQAKGSVPINSQKLQVESEQITLALKGSYLNVTQFLNLLYLAPRIIHIDSLTMTHKESTTSPAVNSSSIPTGNEIIQPGKNSDNVSSRGETLLANQTSNPVGTTQTKSLQDGNSSKQETSTASNNTNTNVSTQANTNTKSNTNVDSSTTQFNKTLQSLSPKELQDMSSVLAAFQSLQQQTNSNPSTSSNQQVLQSSNQPYTDSQAAPVQVDDEVSVTLTLSIYYVPGMNFLGTLSDLPTYKQSGRTNLIVP